MGRQLLAANVTPRPTSKNLQETGLSLRDARRSATRDKPSFRCASANGCFRETETGCSVALAILTDYLNRPIVQKNLLQDGTEYR